MSDKAKWKLYLRWVYTQYWFKTVALKFRIAKTRLKTAVLKKFTDVIKEDV